MRLVRFITEGKRQDEPLRALLNVSYSWHIATTAIQDRHCPRHELEGLPVLVPQGLDHFVGYVAAAGALVFVLVVAWNLRSWRCERLQRVFLQYSFRLTPLYDQEASKS